MRGEMVGRWWRDGGEMVGRWWGGGGEVVGGGGRWREMAGGTCFAPMAETLRASDRWVTVTVFWPMRIVEDPSALGSGARTAPPYRLPSCSAIAISVTLEVVGGGGRWWEVGGVVGDGGR